MQKIRILPILTFNGFALVKTNQFQNPRMVGNPVQSARIFNNRGVDELIFLDIMASKQNRKINLNLVRDVIKQCFMPVGIGGGIQNLEDINDLLKIGADKVVIKSRAIQNPKFIDEASSFFGSQCISISIDVMSVDGIYYIYNHGITDILALDFILKMQDLGAGEIILNSVNNDGMMDGFDIDLYNFIESKTYLPIVMVGGGGDLTHYKNLFETTNCEAVGSSSIFYFTQYTNADIKLTLEEIGKPVRFSKQ
jgi:imidazole glycerol-phosphate synthase subunit HisF